MGSQCLHIVDPGELTFLSKRFSGFKSARVKGDLSTGQHACDSSDRRIQSRQKVCEQVVVIVGFKNGALRVEGRG